MAPEDQAIVESDLHVANDEQTEDASGEGAPNQLSLTVKLTPIIRLLAKQAARAWQEAANDNRDAV